MRLFDWQDTTPKWGKPNPYRRYEAQSGTEQLQLERRQGDKERWFWEISVYGLSCELPGGDLPDTDAKHLGPHHLANQLRRLLAEVER